MSRQDFISVDNRVRLEWCAAMIQNIAASSEGDSHGVLSAVHETLVSLLNEGKSS